MSLTTAEQTTSVVPAAFTGDWALGWRYETVRTVNGQPEMVRVPLTPEEALHPQEGYVMPIRTDHDRISDDLCDMLRPYLEAQADVAVFHDLVFAWDHPAVKPYAPDIAVVPHLPDREKNRGQFVIEEEGARPSLIIEVVSPSSREADRVIKVRDYAWVGVQEYVYIDQRTYKGAIIWEVVGFRLQEGVYLPILTDEDGALYLTTLNLRIGIEDGKVWLEDGVTGENLLTNLEAQRARRVAEERANAAEAQAVAEAEARRAAEARAAEAEARLAELEARFRAQQEQNNKV
jgi:Uma2 family endonuclease